MWLKWEAINLLLPLLYCLCHCRLEDVTFSQTFQLEEIPADLNITYIGTKPSIISCGIQCLSFPNAFSVIACRDSNQAIDCYCTDVTDFSQLIIPSSDAPCLVFTKCKNGGYFDGRVCNCVDGFTGPLCEINDDSDTCVREQITVVDPMDSTAIDIVLNGQGTLKQQIHVDGYDMIFNTVFTSHGFGGLTESAEHLEIDVLDLSNKDIYRLHRMFLLSNQMDILRLGTNHQNWSEAIEDVANIQLKGLISTRLNSTNILCLEVVDAEIIHGSVEECYQGGLRGYSPSFTEKIYSRTVDSVGFRNGNMYFKFLPTMRRNKVTYVANPAIIGHHQIYTNGTASRIFWNIQNHTLNKWTAADELRFYRIYLDRNWHLAYSNDQFGKSKYGFIEYLRDSILGGKRVRVAVQDRIYSVQSTTVSDDFIQVELTDVYDGQAWNQKTPILIRQQVSTSGDYYLCSFESESNVERAGTNGSRSVTWFIENRCWEEIIVFDQDKNIVSGTVQKLYDVALTGKSLRFVLISSTESVIYDAIQVHIFNTSFTVLNSVSGFVNSNERECKYIAYSIYSTGTVEMSMWKPGRIYSSFIRKIITHYQRVQVLSEM